MPVEKLADMINKDCDSFDYFWACGLIKETIAVWKSEHSYSLLCESAQTMADHYLNN